MGEAIATEGESSLQGGDEGLGSMSLLQFGDGREFLGQPLALGHPGKLRYLGFLDRLGEHRHSFA